MKKTLIHCIALLSLLLLAGCSIHSTDPDKVVVLTFDDASESHRSFVAPLLKKHGFGATFFICEFQPDFSTDKEKYMTWEQIQELHEMGFEIGNHTRTHKHVNGMRKPEFLEELGYIEKKCTDRGIPKPTSFCYPGYDTHPMALETLPEQGYTLARIGGNRPFFPGKDNPLLLPSYSTTGTDKERVINAIRQAKKGQIVILTIHGVPDLAHPHVTTPPELFKSYLRYMKENNYTVIALRDLNDICSMKENER